MQSIKRYSTHATPRVNGSTLSMPPRVRQQQMPNYAKILNHYKQVKKQLGVGKPLTLAEKILYSHQVDPQVEPIRNETYLKLVPDRVAMQDASAQMALLQFMLAGKPTTAVPSSIHCDHLIRAMEGADKDLGKSVIENEEIFTFLSQAAQRYGIQFWGPGSGIIHQIVLENYAAPGTLLLGTDSHTPNAGGLGMLAIGVGGADAVDGLAGIPWELRAPKILGVHLTGKLNDWASPKDVILKLAGLLTVQGGTNHIIEYFGPGTQTLTCTGMATICNMGAEVGATTSVFPYSSSMARYLDATGRSDIRSEADQAAQDGYLSADHSCQYDQVVEINLNELEPHINGPFTPGNSVRIMPTCLDAATPISQFKDYVEKNGWKEDIKACLIGSCTNSSYEDMSRAASIAKQALDHGVELQSNFFITPGSEQIRATIQRDGQADILSQVGGTVLANACGPCIGQWDRKDIKQNEENSILTSFNRNFKSRNDGFSKTMNFLASPEIVTAMAFAGKMSFNPMTDTLVDANGKEFKFKPPQGQDLPQSGFEAGRSKREINILGRSDFQPMSLEPQPSVDIHIDPSSTRLQALDSFSPWDGQDFKDMKILVKVQGKCTTDHISAAGPWLKASMTMMIHYQYKGHLDNISNNTLIGATSAFDGKVNHVLNQFTGKYDTIPGVARDYKANKTAWMIIADENYGEGSAREHAALQPRYLGCRVVLARSFARIHGKLLSINSFLETNLKKQGVLPLTFVNSNDYNKITDYGQVSTRGLDQLSPQSIVELVYKLNNGQECIIKAQHSMSPDQIEWFRAGSALNRIALE